MTQWLDYATQVSELTKMAKLVATPVVTRSPPELLAAQRTLECLVCGKRPAQPCGGCRGVDYCGVGHQRDDARFHDPVCDTLREIAEDARARAAERPGQVFTDLLSRAGRCNDVQALAGFDALLGTDASPAERRRLADLATRPLTLAAMLIGLDVRSRAQRTGVLNVHVMAAAEREVELRPEIWALAGRFVAPSVGLELALVGPDLPRRPPHPPHADVVVRTRTALYGRALWAELGRPDLVIGYHCGLSIHPTWRSTILELVGSGIPFVTTTFRPWEAAVEARLLSVARAKCVVAPVANRWASLSARRSSTIANDVSFDNAFVSVWE